MPGERATVAVIVVNWNDTKGSIDCLSSVLASGYEDLLPILVDNWSEIDPTPAVNAAHPTVRVLRVPNGGYAAACNSGAKWALKHGADFLLLMNNDATLDPEALSRLVEASAERPAAILGPLILRADKPDVVWCAGGRITDRWMTNHHLGEGDSPSEHISPSKVQWTTGCALFVAADTYRRIGALDEAYFLYLEDTDWCLRAGRLGVETWIIPGAVVHHRVSTSVSRVSPTRRRYYAYRNRYRLALRFAPPLVRPLIWADIVLTLAKIALRCALSDTYRRDHEYHGRTWGVLDLMRGRWGIGYLSPEPLRRRGSGLRAVPVREAPL